MTLAVIIGRRGRHHVRSIVVMTLAVIMRRGALIMPGTRIVPRDDSCGHHVIRYV